MPWPAADLSLPGIASFVSSELAWTACGVLVLWVASHLSQAAVVASVNSKLLFLANFNLLD